MCVSYLCVSLSGVRFERSTFAPIRKIDGGPWFNLKNLYFARVFLFFATEPPPSAKRLSLRGYDPRSLAIALGDLLRVYGLRSLAIAIDDRISIDRIYRPSDVYNRARLATGLN